MAKILAMINFEQKTSYDIIMEVASRVKTRRKERKFTQAQLAKKAGMSLGSYKRFEQTGQISFQSLVSLAIALDCEDVFDVLFAQKQYSSIEEVLSAKTVAK